MKNDDLKTKGAALLAACEKSFDDKARGWALDYVEMSERRADALAVEASFYKSELARAQDTHRAAAAAWDVERVDWRRHEATHRAELDKKDATLKAAFADCEKSRAALQAERRDRAQIVAAEVEKAMGAERAELAALKARAAELERELETARSGAACRQPWNNPEGGAAERARAQLQDAIHHVQRDGEQGLARLCALLAVELLESSAARRGGARDALRAERRLDIVERRLREIIGQLGVIVSSRHANKAIQNHAREIQASAESALAVLRGEG